VWERIKKIHYRGRKLAGAAVLGLAAIIYRAAQEIGYAPRDAVIFPLLVAAFFLLLTYIGVTSKPILGLVDRFHESFVRESRMASYLLVIGSGAVAGAVISGVGLKLFEMHKQHMHQLEAASNLTKPPASQMSNVPEIISPLRPEVKREPEKATKGTPIPSSRARSPAVSPAHIVRVEPVISVSRATFKREEALHKINLNVDLENFGESTIEAHLTCHFLVDSVPLNLESKIPDRIGFAPHQAINLNLPLTLSPEVDAAFRSGHSTLEVSVKADYKDTQGKKKVYTYKGRLNPDTNGVNTIQSEWR
jgi:hypothetical protein